MDLNIESDTFDPDSHFLFWKPGGTPWTEPDGMAWRADPGTDLVLNVHMQPIGKPELVQPSIGLYFTDRPATKFPMLLQLEHDGALDIPAGASDFAVSDDFVLPMDVDVLAVYPHAHYLGHVLEGYATLPDGPPVADPHSGLGPELAGRLPLRSPYFCPREPWFPCATTTTIRPPIRAIRISRPGACAAATRPPTRWPTCGCRCCRAGSDDRRVELQEALMRHRLEKYPGDFNAHFNLGDALLTQGNAAGALPYFQAAFRANPGNVVAATELGVALFTASKLAEAEEQFQAALAIDPAYTDARFDLASVQAARGEWEPAVNEFRRVLR